MRQSIYMPLLLTGVVFGSALILGGLNMLTAPVIAAQSQAEMENTLSFLVPGGTVGAMSQVEDAPGIVNRYPATLDDGRSALILMLNGSGFGGDMIVMALYDGEGILLKSALLDNQETPGFGKQAESQRYMRMFYDRYPVPARKDMIDPEYVDAVTGVTITFNGISSMLEAGSDYARRSPSQP